MTDRLEEIERRLAQRPKNGGLAVPSWGDIEFLLGEVRRIISIADEHERNCNLMHQHHNRMMDERDEAQSLALSLAEVLNYIQARINHHPANRANIAELARSVLSDERLTKLREMKNG